MRKRNPLTTAYLTVLFIGQIFSFLVATDYARKDPLRSVFNGMWRWWLELVILMLFLWALESIRRWNKRGFWLYIGCCAVTLCLNVYDLIITSQRIEGSLLGWSGLRPILGPVLSPVFLWAALQLGLPGAWRQMGTPQSAASRVGAPDQERV